VNYPRWLVNNQGFLSCVSLQDFVNLLAGDLLGRADLHCLVIGLHTYFSVVSQLKGVVEVFANDD